MPHHSEKRRLTQSPEHLFDLVADVESYPQFLPWCLGARITSRENNVITADLVIGFKMFREKFTSRVVLDRPSRIEVDYIKGPLRHLHNHWGFTPLAEGGTEIDFSVDFAFKNVLFERLVGSLFDEAVGRMVNAFEKRANALYPPAA